MTTEIVSSANERIKRLSKLQQNRKARDAERLFVVEERRVFERALRSGFEPAEVYTTPELIETGIDTPIEVVQVAESALSRASYRNKTTGLLALFEYLPTQLPVDVSDRDVFLVVEGVEKPGNLGAMLRIADAADLAGLVLVDSVVDVFNPNVVRASTGAIFTVQISSATLAEVEAWLDGTGIESIAMTPEAKTEIWDVDFSNARQALWIGAEAVGLSAESRSLASFEARIPMAGASDSLNAAVSAAIVAYESVRQRRGTAD